LRREDAGDITVVVFRHWQRHQPRREARLAGNQLFVEFLDAPRSTSIMIDDVDMENGAMMVVRLPAGPRQGARPP